MVTYNKLLINNEFCTILQYFHSAYTKSNFIRPAPIYIRITQNKHNRTVLYMFYFLNKHSYIVWISPLSYNGYFSKWQVPNIYCSILIFAFNFNTHTFNFKGLI